MNSKRKYSSAYSLSKIIFTDTLKIISKKHFVNLELREISFYLWEENIQRLYPRVKKVLKIIKIFMLRILMNCEFLQKSNMLQNVIRRMNSRKIKNLKYFMFLQAIQ